MFILTFVWHVTYWGPMSVFSKLNEIFELDNQEIKYPNINPLLNVLIKLAYRYKYTLAIDITIYKPLVDYGMMLQ